MQHKTSNFQKYIYSILTLCYVLYHTHINFIITTQSPQKLSLCRYPYIDIELCDHCFALPCECVPINIIMKEGKGKLKCFKNLIKVNEICTMKCMGKICHNDQSFILMNFICIIYAKFCQKIQ